MSQADWEREMDEFSSVSRLYEPLAGGFTGKYGIYLDFSLLLRSIWVISFRFVRSSTAFTSTTNVGNNTSGLALNPLEFQKESSVFSFFFFF